MLSQYDKDSLGGGLLLYIKNFQNLSVEINLR